MGIRQFDNIMFVWNIVFFAILIFCIINAILSVRRKNRKFVLSYVLEAVTVLINVGFMYIINGRYIDYGDNKFSGLAALGDWYGFAILIIITIIPVLITVICTIYYTVWNRKNRVETDKGKEL